jgi:release factor glutamine methyltransferase
MADTWTIRKLIEWMVGYFTDRAIDTPRLTAELLLSHVLQMKRIELYMHFDKPVEPDKLAELRALVKRTSEHEPYAYLIGRTEFYSMEINVSRDCLIPRPETELLVERAIEFLRTRKAGGTQKICDLCTGSGCIAVAIAKNFPDCKIIATDISDAALAVADINIKKHNLEKKIELLAGDLFAPVIAGLDETKFDLIASNPPYISESEFEQLDKNVKDHEPRQALYGGADGFDIYRRIIASVPEHLKPDGVLMMEIGYLQGDGIRKLLEPVFSYVKIEKDISDNDRVVIASNRMVENYRPDFFDGTVDRH